MYNEVEVQDLQREFQVAIGDVEADMPDVEAGFEVDLAQGVCGCSQASEDSIKEFCRREFGYLPYWCPGAPKDYLDDDEEL